MVALLEQPRTTRRLRPAPQIDRRIFAREEVNIQADARRLDHSLPAYRQPYINLIVRDLSVGGISALSDVPLLKGEHVGVSFPANFPHRPWDAFGRVIRCEPSALGYHVAVEFDPLPAA